MIDRARDVWRRLAMLQRGMPFKIGASIVVVAIALGIMGYTGLSAARDANDATQASEQGVSAEEAGEGAQGNEGVPAGGVERDNLTRAREAVGRMLSGRESSAGVMLATTIGMGVALVVIWLGLAIWYVALLGVGGLIAYGIGGLIASAGLTRLLLGMIVLVASFSALLQGLRALFGGPGPVFAIARNVLAEAVRLKLSLVLIVLLVFALSAIPGLIDSDDALRYRVQSLLQYGTGGTFWIIALLVVLLSVASVAYDQRDRTIWQTMTKPVKAWQYVLGKWVGVAGISAVLLGVCASGVFLFVDYVRAQPARGEVRAYEAAGGLISEDRMVLETRILSARVGKKPDPAFTPDDPGFLQEVGRYIDDQRRSNPGFAQSDEEYAEVVQSLYKSAIAQSFRLPPGQFTLFRFSGLSSARESDRLLTLHYKVTTSVNNPTNFYRVQFGWEGAQRLIEQEVALGTINRVELPNDAIMSDGRLEIFMRNAGRTDSPGETEVLTVPEGDGMELAYSVGSYHLNFARVVLVLWVKLLFLSMIGIFAATFLSFPVAALLSVAVFLAAEGAGFVATSLESFRTTDQKGNLIFINWATAQVSEVVTGLFRVYANLRPTGRLVEGRLLSWQDVATGVLVLGAIASILFALATLIFRRRELAIYSGH